MILEGGKQRQLRYAPTLDGVCALSPRISIGDNAVAMLHPCPPPHGYVQVACEALAVRLLACNATEGDLVKLLGDWRAAKRDGSLLRLAATSGALR